MQVDADPGPEVVHVSTPVTASAPEGAVLYRICGSAARARPATDNPQTEMAGHLPVPGHSNADQPFSAAIHDSTSSDRRGSAALRFRLPSSVTRMSSSIRTPMPRYSSGTVRSSAWK